MLIGGYDRWASLASMSTLAEYRNSIDGWMTLYGRHTAIDAHKHSEYH